MTVNEYLHHCLSRHVAVMRLFWHHERERSNK